MIITKQKKIDDSGSHFRKKGQIASNLKIASIDLKITKIKAFIEELKTNNRILD